jgi:hypothetical protein
LRTQPRMQMPNSMIWSETFLAPLTDNDSRLAAYVPDNVLTRLSAASFLLTQSPKHRG